MTLFTCLNYGGNCRQAFEFYAEHLGWTITMLTTHGEQPDAGNVAPEWRHAVLHARIEIGETMILGADILPDRFQPMRSAYLADGGERRGGGPRPKHSSRACSRCSGIGSAPRG